MKESALFRKKIVCERENKGAEGIFFSFKNINDVRQAGNCVQTAQRLLTKKGFHLGIILCPKVSSRID